MTDIVFFAAVIWLTALVGLSVIALGRRGSVTTRILALDQLTLIQVALLVLLSAYQDVAYYLDAALVLALLAFVGTLAAARYHAERRLL